jgi:ABC-type Zn uptake system ZnuABC Zn-binding protein ZnuA
MQQNNRFAKFKSKLQEKTRALTQDPASLRHTLIYALITILIIVAGFYLFFGVFQRKTDDGSLAASRLPNLPGKQLKIATSFLPAYEATRYVTGFNTADSISVVIPFENASPVEYKLSNENKKIVQEADVLVGLNSREDANVFNEMKKLNSKATVIDLGQAAGDTSELFWLNAQTMDKMVSKVSESLSSINKDKASFYENNLVSARQVLSSLTQFQAQVAEQCKAKSFVSFGISQLPFPLTIEKANSLDEFIKKLEGSDKQGLLNAGQKNNLQPNQNIKTGQIVLFATMQSSLENQISNGATYTSLMNENLDRLSTACK